MKYLNFNDEEQYSNEVLLNVPDNGYWEYNRIGFGKDDEGYYMFCSDDTGEELREKFHMKVTLTEALAKAVEMKIFDKGEGNHYWIDEEYCFSNSGEEHYKKWLDYIGVDHKEWVQLAVPDWSLYISIIMKVELTQAILDYIDQAVISMKDGTYERVDQAVTDIVETGIIESEYDLIAENGDFDYELDEDVQDQIREMIIERTRN